MADADHRPAAGCKGTKCGVGDPENCPFIMDKYKPSYVQQEAESAANHQHVYVLACSCGDIRAITPSNTEHGIIGDSNRGWTPFA